MIRVTTEHNGVREFPDDHVPEILEAATLHVMDGAGKTVLLVAEGEWRSVEISADSDAYPPDRLGAISAVIASAFDPENENPPDRDQYMRAIYDAAVDRG